MNTVAIVPIKLTNERLPGKNIKLLAGKPLISYILNTLSTIEEISEIYVFCSDERIKEFLPLNVRFLQRPQWLDEPTSNFSQIFEAFKDKIDADVYLYAHATAPFISATTIRECLNALKNGYDSAFTAVKIQDFLWKENEPLNFDASDIPRSQDLQAIFRETSGIYVFEKKVFEKYHRRVGKKPYIKEVGFREAIDINYPEDFQIAEKFVQLED